MDVRMKPVQAEEQSTGDDPTQEAPARRAVPVRRSAARRLLGWLGEVLVIIVGALVISTLLRTFVAQMFVIPSGSMENTLQINDRVLVAKFGGFQRGDVVVFEDPAHWLAPAPPTTNPVRQAFEFIGFLPNSGVEHLIKRVVGMPGDRVACCDAEGRVTVNGVALDERAYLYSEGGVQVAPANVPFDVVVPAERIFVMGDHRNASADSRCKLTMISQGDPPGMAAFVPVDKVVGSAVAIVAPLNRLATFRVPETFGNIPPPDEPAPLRPTIREASPGC